MKYVGALATEIWIPLRVVRTVVYMVTDQAMRQYIVENLNFPIRYTAALSYVSLPKRFAYFSSMNSILQLVRHLTDVCLNSNSSTGPHTHIKRDEQSP